VSFLAICATNPDVIITSNSVAARAAQQATSTVSATLVRQHCSQIERLATALMERETLTDEHVDGLLLMDTAPIRETR
jgi:hypothetical protein